VDPDGGTQEEERKEKKEKEKKNLLGKILLLITYCLLEII
jgi:hypothetical protein